MSSMDVPTDFGASDTVQISLGEFVQLSGTLVGSCGSFGASFWDERPFASLTCG